MNGDLSIALQPPTADLAASVRRGRAAAARPVPAPGASQEQAAVLCAAVGQLEAQRLKALLTDPAMQVSTHADEASGRFVLRVQDRATGELVEQIPADALLRLYAALRASLVDEEA
ncbi:MAG TPA: flagellar protein FlaG [Geminicoccaceae bacterium]|nr:flagellar protein FlaG [Geminicoccaceae bacterium]